MEEVEEHHGPVVVEFHGLEALEGLYQEERGLLTVVVSVHFS